MGMKTIAIVSEKGGTGKTTAATHLAAGFALRGKRVLLVDFDHQANATLSFGLEPQPGVKRMVCDYEKDPAIAVTVGENPARQFWLVPSDETTGFLPEDIFVESIGRFDGLVTLRNALDAQMHRFDVAIIDTNPTIGDSMALVYNAADCAIVTTTPSRFALNGLVSTVEHMTPVPLLGVAVTQYQHTWSSQKAHMRALKEHCAAVGWRLFAPIYMSAAWADAATYQRMVWDIPFHSKRPAKQAWRLVDEVEEAMDAI